jgi:hypothetical protein
MLDSKSIDRIIEMAWEDCTPFEAIRLHLVSALFQARQTNTPFQIHARLFKSR